MDLIQKYAKSGRPRQISFDLEADGSLKPTPKTPASQREYMKQYYKIHREKAREYQRQYNLTHKKKVRLKATNSSAGREAVRSTFTTRDIMQSPTEKTLKILKMIVSGERQFTL